MHADKLRGDPGKLCILEVRCLPLHRLGPVRVVQAVKGAWAQ